MNMEWITVILRLFLPYILSVTGFANLFYLFMFMYFYYVFFVLILFTFYTNYYSFQIK